MVSLNVDRAQGTVRIVPDAQARGRSGVRMAPHGSVGQKIVAAARRRLRGSNEVVYFRIPLEGMQAG